MASVSQSLVGTDLPQEIRSMIFSHLFNFIPNLCHLLDLRVVSREFNEQILSLVFLTKGHLAADHYHTSQYWNISCLIERRRQYVSHHFPPGLCGPDCRTEPRVRFYALSRFALQAALHRKDVLPKSYFKLIEKLSTAVAMLSELLCHPEYTQLREQLSDRSKLRTSSTDPVFTDLASRAVCHVAIIWLSEPAYRATRYTFNDRWLERERPAFWVLSVFALAGSVKLFEEARTSIAEGVFAKFGGNRPRFVAKMLLLPVLEGHSDLMQHLMSISARMRFDDLNRWSIIDLLVTSGCHEFIKMLLATDKYEPDTTRVERRIVALDRWRFRNLSTSSTTVMFDVLFSAVEKYHIEYLPTIMVSRLERLVHAAAGRGHLPLLKRALDKRSRYPDSYSCYQSTIGEAAKHGQVACLSYMLDRLEAMDSVPPSIMSGLPLPYTVRCSLTVPQFHELAVETCFGVICENEQWETYLFLKQWCNDRQHRYQTLSFYQLAGLSGSLQELERLQRNDPQISRVEKPCGGDQGAWALRSAIMKLHVEHVKFLLIHGAARYFMRRHATKEVLFIDVRWSKDTGRMSAFGAIQDLLTEHRLPISITYDYVQLHMGEKMTDCAGESHSIDRKHLSKLKFLSEMNMKAMSASS